MLFWILSWLAWQLFLHIWNQRCHWFDFHSNTWWKIESKNKSQTALLIADHGLTAAQRFTSTLFFVPFFCDYLLTIGIRDVRDGVRQQFGQQNRSWNKDNWLCSWHCAKEDGRHLSNVKDAAARKVSITEENNLTASNWNIYTTYQAKHIEWPTCLHRQGCNRCKTLFRFQPRLHPNRLCQNPSISVGFKRLHPNRCIHCWCHSFIARLNLWLIQVADSWASNRRQSFLCGDGCSSCTMPSIVALDFFWELASK